MRPVLTATVHDPAGHFLPGLARTRDALREVFGSFAMQVTTQTATAVVRFLTEDLEAVVRQAPADGQVGLHRRRAVELALPTEAPVVHIDLDHMLRWVEADRAELEGVLQAATGVDLLVVGRTAAAMNACPRRLRDTESIINHVYALITGHHWDLMFGVRVLSPACAQAIVDNCSEDTIGNDVAWPLYAETTGFRVGYAEADGLSYRTRADFDSAADRRDDDPLRWIDRIGITNQQAQAMRRFAAARR
jgi:hypothetical protein